MTAPRAAFLVVRASLSTVEGNFPSLFDDVNYQPLEEADRGPLRVPEAVFFNRPAAERDRDRRNVAARELLNPFWLFHGELEWLTSAPETEFRDRLRILGLTPPLSYATNFGPSTDWWLWWDAESANWTAEQRSAVWDLLDKVRLFDVVEIELE
jgi:hypothetical protein